jgi:hypothetical protein
MYLPHSPVHLLHSPHKFTSLTPYIYTTHPLHIDGVLLNETHVAALALSTCYEET